jgi:PAS domain-containing protein
VDWRTLISDSYRQLVDPGWLAPEELDGATAVVLCHDTAEDPCFVYANAAAARLWGRPVADFLGWPSRFTAPPEERASRAAALSGPGVVRGYRGTRIDSAGRRFQISNAHVWPVLDPAGLIVGQAATFSEWEWLDHRSDASTGPRDTDAHLR